MYFSNMIAAADVREKMNRYGADGTPFLFAFDFEMERGLFEPNPLDSKRILFRVGDIKNYSSPLSESFFARLFDDDLLKIVNPPDKAHYSNAFDLVFKGLKRGDTYLINLTCATEVNTVLSFEEIITNTTSPYALCVPGCFVCFSPERFVSINKGIITSSPMKGTIDATLPDAEKIILADYKESCEHNTITDLIRNDIGAVSERVWVDRFRYTDRIITDRGEIIQVSSDIKGELKTGWENQLGDIIYNLLPAGSVSGAPKPSTLKLISKAEGEKRGFYTGVFGYFDGKSLDSAVLIRFIEKRADGRMFYRSGGGVTVNSSEKDEYLEALSKVYMPIKK